MLYYLEKGKITGALRPCSKPPLASAGWELWPQNPVVTLKFHDIVKITPYIISYLSDG